MTEPKGRGDAWTDEGGTTEEGRRRLGSGPEASETSRASEPKGRGGAWTEERGTSEEGRRRLGSGPEASETSRASEPKGRGGAWTEERGTSDEGRRRLESGPEASEPILAVHDLTVHHGQLRALDRISLRVFPGEVYAIIGANGAGKSTLLRTIAGLHHPTEGSIRYDGQDVTKVRPERRATRGIAMVPEGRRLFGSLTVEENLQIGATYARKGPWTIERVYELFGWMTDRRTQRTAQLSGGEQQSVAIGRALVANPRVLLLDELSLGLAPVVVQRIYGTMPQILASGITVLLVEQDVSQALRVASHLQCLLEGHTTLEGRPSDVTPQQVEAAYFGLAPQGPGSLGPTGPGSLGPTGPGSPPASGGPGGYGEAGGSPASGGPGGYGGAGSPSQGGSGGMGLSQGGSGGMGPPGRNSRGGLGGIVPPEGAEEQLWSGSTTSSRGS